MMPVLRELVRYRAAGFWRRLLAGFIDAWVLLPLAVLLAMLLGTLSTGRFPHVRELGVDYVVELLLGHDPLVIGGAAVCIFVFLLYFVLFHAIQGRTLGKRICKIRVINRTGERPTLLRSLLRAAAGLLSVFLCGLGFIWIAFDREKRSLHDWLAGTYVVCESD